jgi:hypothetical protein
MDDLPGSLDGMQGVRGSNPLSSTRHNASSTPALSAVCQQFASKRHWVAVRTLSASPGRLLVEGRFGRRQHHRQALLDRGQEAGGHLRGGVPVVGADGAAPVPPGPAAGLVAHHLVDDPGRDAGVLQPGREGVPKVVGAVEVDRIQQRMVGGWPERPACRRAVAGGGAGLGELLEGTADGRDRAGAPLGAQLGGELLGAERPTVTQRRQDAGGGRAEPGGRRVGELGERARGRCGGSCGATAPSGCPSSPQGHHAGQGRRRAR